MKHKKLRAQFKDCAGSFPWRDAVTILSGLGYELQACGKTGGSRRRFYNPATKHMIMMHEQHAKDMKPYAVRQLRDELNVRKLLEVSDDNNSSDEVGKIEASADQATGESEK
jgi:hypothetical protein